MNDFTNVFPCDKNNKTPSIDSFAVTLVSGLLMFLLFVSELSFYLTTEVRVNSGVHCTCYDVFAEFYSISFWAMLQLKIRFRGQRDLVINLG